MNQSVKHCLYCDLEYHRIKGKFSNAEWGKKKYCSKECYAAARKQRLERKLSDCSRQLYADELHRFRALLDVNNVTGCHTWVGHRDKKGYGKFMLRGKCKRAHRVAYEHYCGRIPDGLMLDHLCRNPSCCNPDHLEAVTNGENVRRGAHQGRAKTHCPAGHPYAGENLRIGVKGERRCRACQRTKDREKHRYAAVSHALEAIHQ